MSWPLDRLIIDELWFRERVFVLGPSHHVYLDGCALSKCTEYETPLGPLPLDLDSMFTIYTLVIELLVY